MKKDFTFWERVLLWVSQKIEKKVYKREWTYRDQVLYARRMCEEDAQWFCMNQMVSLVCRRHLRMLQESWYTKPHDTTPMFRHAFHKDLNEEVPLRTTYVHKEYYELGNEGEQE